MRLRSISPLALALVVLACQDRQTGPAAAADPAKGEAVARLNGREITLGELEAWMKEDLFKRELADKPAGEVYEQRVLAVDQLVNERLVDEAAKAAGQTPDAFMAAQIAKLGPVTDDEVKAFFEENKARMGAGATLEAMAQRIRPYLENQRTDRARADLRAAAKIDVLIQPPRMPIEAVGPSLGPADAPVTLIEFSDYQCPFCKRVEPTVQQLLAKYPTQVRLVFRHLPLDGLHPQARAASHAAVCAESQGKFWEYHAKLFESQHALADEDLAKYASELGLDGAQFKACMQAPETQARVQRDADAARSAGITGTPAFFVNGILISGARPLEDFSKWIDQELAAKGTSAGPG